MTCYLKFINHEIRDFLQTGNWTAFLEYDYPYFKIIVNSFWKITLGTIASKLKSELHTITLVSNLWNHMHTSTITTKRCRVHHAFACYPWINTYKYACSVYYKRIIKNMLIETDSERCVSVFIASFQTLVQCLNLLY